MKSLQTLSLALIVFIAFSFTSSVQGYKQDLVGTWKIATVSFDPDPIKTLQDMGASPQQISQSQAMLDAMVNSIKDNTSMTFNADGTYEAKSLNPTTQQSVKESGKWSISVDGKKITTTTSEGDSETIDIDFVSSSNFKIKDNSTPNMAVVLSFEKQ